MPRFVLPWMLLATILITACQPNTNSTPPQPAAASPSEFKAEPGQTTPIHFAHLQMNFKPVTSGDTVVAVYPFKNMSKETVKITQAATSCQCMQTSFPTGNIQPGQQGEVKVNFLTEGQQGRHEKIIAVVLENYQETITLRLNGQINPKSQP